MPSGEQFLNLYSHDFVRLAVAIPRLQVADPHYNAAGTISQMRQAGAEHAALVLFPELGLSAYSCEDLFHQRALLNACEEALADVLAASEPLSVVAVIGLPVQVGHLLYNCAAVLCRGQLLGVVPKTYLPNYREFYEARNSPRATRHSRTRLNCVGSARCRLAVG